MKKTLTISLLLLCLLAFTSTQTTFAQTATVGVGAGNTFNYNYVLTWESTDPTATMPNEITQLQDVKSIQLKINSVEGTRINLDSIKQFKNGQENIQNGNIDVNLQVLEVPYSNLIIRANANPGEKVYPLGGRPILNETSTRTYSIGQVETIHYISTETLESGSQKTEIFYDRANGVALEATIVSKETSGSYVSTTTVTLTLNSWVIPEFPSTAFLMLLLIAIPIVLVAYKKRGLSNHKFTITLRQ
jgi:hypothetical protein